MKHKLHFIIVLTLTALSCADERRNTIVSTYAGNGTMGSLDGQRREASFSNLTDLAADERGNLYVADSRNNRIRKISPDGLVTTLAGSGKVGSADGKGAAASFFFPTALAVDTKGTVWVADTHNNLVRKISADGVVTTVAGRKGLTFDNPGGIAVDSSGNVFVSDWHDRILKIRPDGNVSVYAGTGKRGSSNGAAATASFYLPSGLAVDDSQNLFVVDSYNNQIRKVNSEGQVTTFCGRQKRGSADGPADSALFFHPRGIAIDKMGNIFITDTGNNLIRKIGADHKVTTLAGSGGRGCANGPAAAATFWNPTGVAVDPARDVYIADNLNNVIRKITCSTTHRGKLGK